MREILFAAAIALFAAPTWAAPDEDLLGKSEGYPHGTPETAWDEQYRVGSFSAMERVFPLHCTVAASSDPLPLTEAPAEPAIRYRSGGKTLTIDDYLARYRVTGLLILKDGEIQVERYQYDRTRDTRFLSNSMAKSVLSMALGVALGEGKIASLDDTAAKYEQRLAGTAYGETTLRNLLHMSSGVKFTETYGKNDDLARWLRLSLVRGSLYATKQFNERVARQGLRYAYASSQTQVLNLALRAATGRSLCDWTSEKIWQPMGAEKDAIWLASNADRVEYAFFGFNATLRDYGRLGLLLANYGKRGETQVIPESYLLDATRADRQPKGFRPGDSREWGYGLHFRILPGEKPRFALTGVFGQHIFVDPSRKLVMVQTSVGKRATGFPEAYQLWQSILAHYGE